MIETAVVVFGCCLRALLGPGSRVPAAALPPHGLEAHHATGAAVTADAVGRQNGITTAQVTAFLNSAAGTIDPDATSGTSEITVAAIHRDGDDAAEVSWRRGQDAGSSPHQGGCQKVGNAGAAAVLPTGFTVDADDTVIIAEACYTFVPAFLVSRAVFNLDFVPLDIYARAISAARFGGLTVLEP